MEILTNIFFLKLIRDSQQMQQKIHGTRKTMKKLPITTPETKNNKSRFCSVSVFAVTDMQQKINTSKKQKFSVLYFKKEIQGNGLVRRIPKIKKIHIKCKMFFVASNCFIWLYRVATTINKNRNCKGYTRKFWVTSYDLPLIKLNRDKTP